VSTHRARHADPSRRLDPADRHKQITDGRVVEHSVDGELDPDQRACFAGVLERWSFRPGDGASGAVTLINA